MKYKKMTEESNDSKFAIPKKNVVIILIGLAVLVIGFFLLSGGGSDDPDVFNYEMFDFRRLVLAPIIILLGFGIEVYAIMKKPKK